MSVIVTIYKKDFPPLVDLNDQLIGLCSEVKELQLAYVYVPAAGKLMAFINLVRQHQIPYGVFSPSDTDKQGEAGNGR